MNRFWSNTGKVFGSLFLLSGGTVTLGLSAAMVTSHAGGIWLTLLSVPMVIFGVAPTSLGGLLMYTSFRAEQRAIRDCFFQLLRSRQGRFSLLDFAATTRLEPAIARRHLDAWAKTCSACFEVTEEGDLYYIFSTDLAALQENYLSINQSSDLSKQA
jgi:hypothetical protein